MQDCNYFEFSLSNQVLSYTQYTQYYISYGIIYVFVEEDNYKPVDTELFKLLNDKSFEEQQYCFVKRRLSIIEHGENTLFVCNIDKRRFLESILLKLKKTNIELFV